MSTEQTIQLLRETLKGVLKLANVEIGWGSKAWAKAAGTIQEVLDETQHPREQPHKETGNIHRTVFYRNSFDGGDGWTYFPMLVELSPNCPKCGQKRGEPWQGRVIEDGETFAVDQWVNPCGHVDSYGDCWKEHQQIQRTKTYQGVESSPDPQPTAAPVYSDQEIEQLMHQPPLPEGWTEFSQNEPAGDKLARINQENQES